MEKNKHGTFIVIEGLDVSPRTCLGRIKKRNKNKTLFEKEKELKKSLQRLQKIFSIF